MTTKIIKSKSVYAALTAVAAFIIYLPALKNGFVDWDDNIYIYQNQMITNFNMEFIKWSFTNFAAFNWHPLTWMSHALDYAVWGLNPMGHHLTSIIFHGIDTFLVTLLAIRLLEIGKGVLKTDNSILFAGIIAGLLFGLHPLHVESAAWVSERKDVLSACFFLLSLLSYLRYTTTEYRDSRAWQSKMVTISSFIKSPLSSLFQIPKAFGTLLEKKGKGRFLHPYNYLSLKGSPDEEKDHFFSYFFRKYYLLSLAFFFLGLLSKPMVITLPAVLLILDWYPLKRFTRATLLSFPLVVPKAFGISEFPLKKGGVRGLFQKDCGQAAMTETDSLCLPADDRISTGSRSLVYLLYEKIPFFFLSLASSAITVLAQRGALASFTGLSLTSRLLSAMKSLIVYLEKMLWPAGLMPFYPYPANITIFSLEYFVPVLLLVGITSACIYVLKTKKQRVWLSVWGYYIITMLPVIGIVQVGKQEFADRYMYLPSIGPFILIGIAAGLFFEILRKQKMAIKVVSLSVPFIIFLSMSYATSRQIAVWKNGITLWSREIEVLGQNSGKEYLFLNIPFYNRGAAYADRGYWDQAIEDFSMAIYLDQVDFTAYYLRGSMYANKKDYQNALNDYNVAIYLSPKVADIYYSRAFVYSELRRYPEAIDDITKAINLTAAPPSDYYYNRGMIFKKLGYEKEAARDFMQAQNIDRRNFQK